MIAPTAALEAGPRAPARHFPYRRRATKNFRVRQTLSEMSDLSCQIRRRPLTNALLSALGWRLRSASLTETGIDLFDGSSRSFFFSEMAGPALESSPCRCATVITTPCTRRAMSAPGGRAMASSIRSCSLTAYGPSHIRGAGGFHNRNPQPWRSRTKSRRGAAALAVWSAAETRPKIRARTDLAFG